MGPWAWITSGVAGAWLLSKLTGSSRARTQARGHRTPPGPEFLAAHKPFFWPSTEAGRKGFVKYVYQKLGELNLLHDRPAILFIAHTARETGWGHSVYNNNFGNEKQFGAGPWMREPDGEPYMHFDTGEQGLAHAVQRIARQWPGPWQKLLAGDNTWYGDLGLGGYYEYSPPRDPVTGIRPPPRRHTPETIGPVQHEYDRIAMDVVRRLS